MGGGAVPAEVIAIIDISGTKGVKRARCKILDGKYKDKVIIRNIMGPIKIGDIVMIKEADMEVSGVID